MDINIKETYQGIDLLIAQKCDDGNGILEESKEEISIFTKAKQEFEASGDAKEVTIKGVKYYYDKLLNILKDVNEKFIEPKPHVEEPDALKVANTYVDEYNLTQEQWAEKWWNSSGKDVRVKNNLQKYIQYFENASKETGIPVSILVGVCCKESTMGVGSSNIMRLQSKTAKSFGCKNVNNKEQNILAAAKYLKYLLDKANGNMAKALVGYNAGEYSTAFKNFKYIYKGGYADKVLSLSKEYEKLA